jgi:hypothetical protein
MPGPTDFPQVQTVTNVSVQAVPATTETVICTSNPINSRGSNYPINVQASAVYAINATTTGVTMRLRLGTVTGSLIGVAQVVNAATAGTESFADGTIGAQYQPALEVAGLLIVLTVQAAGAGAAWNTTFAQLFINQ